MNSTLEFATFFFSMRHVSSLVTIVSCCLLMGTADSAFAEMEQPIALNLNFRSPLGENARRQYRRRTLEQSGTESSTTGSGSLNSFDRRAKYLREAKLQLIQETLKEKEFTGKSRTGAYENHSNARAKARAVRRIRAAEQGGGIRLRQGTPSQGDRDSRTIEEKRQRSEQNRQEIKDTELKRFHIDEDAEIDCVLLIGKRRAKCFYDLRQEH